MSHSPQSSLQRNLAFLVGSFVTIIPMTIKLNLIILIVKVILINEGFKCLPQFQCRPFKKLLDLSWIGR